MYRQGLGDCFLLTFPGRSGPVHLLLDCGAFPSKHYDAARMNDVVRDIKTATRGHIDVVVGTHEHWDHVSGFAQARALWDEIAVDRVWVAWTEEPDNEAARVLRDRFKKQKAAVEMALRRIGAAGVSPHLERYRTAVTELFGFFGGLGAADGAGRTEEAWDYLLGKGEKVYCHPARPPLELPGVGGVRIYVLGPPEDPEYVKKLVSKKETYDTALQPLSLAESILAATGGERQDEDLRARARPFDPQHGLAPDEAARRSFFQEHYGFGDGDGGEGWRRIDTDWLTVAGELALHLDSYTNNTCLALAIELVESGRVLLFPGDAQVGNWLSWADRTWTVTGADCQERLVTAQDLLARTVLYKVGHHGSHNATLRAKGLEQMSSPDLVAMIPVHRATADDQKWKFPFRPLWDRLMVKANGRVLLADDEGIDHLQAEVEHRLSATAWKRFESAISARDLFVEYRIPL
jgi:hypothetical protein